MKKAVPANPKRVVQMLVVMACAIGLVAAASGQALAKTSASKKPTSSRKSKLKPTTPISKGSTYLALGDSVTFGYQEPTVVPTPNYANASSFLGYPEMLGSELHLKVVNAACPGETSASMINASAQSNGCENSPSPTAVPYRAHFPLHASYTGSQLAFAVSYLKKHQNVRLVSLMIGANDGLLCEESTADHCTSFAEQAALLTGIEKNIHTILSAIRNKAHYNGQLAIVNYYSIDSASATDNEQETLLNQGIDGAAKPFHVVVADGFGSFAAASVDSGNDTCKAGLLTQLSTGGCGIHPSYAGASLLAQSLEKVIRVF